MIKKILIMVLFIELLNAQMVHRMQVEMGTFISISLEKEHERYIKNGFSIIRSVSDSLSSYDKEAIIYTLNEQKSSAIDTYTYEALELSRAYYDKTDGYFNIAIGSITKDLYHFGEQERVPSKDALKEVKINFNGIFFNKTYATLAQGVKVDLGGMGKGFGVDKVAEYFLDKNITKAIIAASGDIRCLDICPIDIQNPFNKTPLASFETLHKNSSISTSGNYNRYVDSTNNNHLINPKTKKPQSRFISITLISQLPNSDIDAYATAASVMPIDKAYKFLDSLDLAYIILQSDKQLIISENISQFSKNLLVHYTKK